jgi:hypothetical protein
MKWIPIGASFAVFLAWMFFSPLALAPACKWLARAYRSAGMLQDLSDVCSVILGFLAYIAIAAILCVSFVAILGEAGDE